MFLFKITVFIAAELMSMWYVPAGTALVYDLPGGWMQWLG